MSAPVRIPKSSSSPIAKASSKSLQARNTPSTCSSTHSSPKHHHSSASSSSSSSGSSTKDSHRRYSRPDLMSSSLKSQDDYLVYEIPSADSESGLGSVVIIPKSSQGFSWNEGTYYLPYLVLERTPVDGRCVPVEVSVESLVADTTVRLDGGVSFQR